MNFSPTIRIQQWVFPQGSSKNYSDQPLPLEVAGPISRKAVNIVCEGAIDMYIGDVGVITRELTCWGYLFGWWNRSVLAVEDLLELRSTVWDLPDMVLEVRINVIAGTRRITVQLYNRQDEERGPIAETHVKALTDALLDGAEAFIRWGGEIEGDNGLTIGNIERLRAAPAPWKPKQY